MPNIASALKSEIARISRKEIRAEVSTLRKAVSDYRNQIAGLRRQMDALERIRFAPSASRTLGGGDGETPGRFLAIAVYKWESGKTKPRARQVEAIASIRSLGRREALAKLEADGEKRPRGVVVAPQAEFQVLTKM